MASVNLLLSVLLAANTLSTFETATSYMLTDISFAGGPITTISSLNDSLYFAGGSNFYSFSPSTNNRTLLGRIPITSQYSSSTTLNGKVYTPSFSAEGLYEYDSDSGLIQVTQRDIANAYEGVTALNGKVYFGSDTGNLSEYDPVSKQSRIVSKINLGDLTGVASLSYTGKVYTGSLDVEGVYEFDPITSFTQLISSTMVGVRRIIEYDNSLYFLARQSGFYQYDPIKKNFSTLCEFPEPIYPSGLAVLNQEIYIGGIVSRNLWKLNRETGTCVQIPLTIPEHGNAQALETLNNKLYIGSNNSILYEYYEVEDVADVSTLHNLDIISNIDDKEV